MGGIFSFITPPVAIASMVCAKLADAPFLRTGMLAVRYAGVSYVLPFLIILCPAITFQDTRLVPMVTQICGCFGILFALSILIEGYWFIECRWWERVLAFLSFAAFFFALWIQGLLWLLLIGFGLLAVITLRQLKVKSGGAAVEKRNCQ